MKLPCLKPIRNTVCFGGALLSGASMMLAQNAASGKVDKLEKKTQELRKRLDALEAVAQKEGIMPSGNPASKPISAMSNISVSGYVQASYFFNSTHPADRLADGYLWTTRQNSFSLNKFKLTLASPPAE